jgi:hypothetical protein
MARNKRNVNRWYQRRDQGYCGIPAADLTGGMTRRQSDLDNAAGSKTPGALAEG